MFNVKMKNPQATGSRSIDVPLNELRLSEQNARKSGATLHMEEMVASIRAHGLLQPLAVSKAKDGVYEVVDGKRRMTALTIMAEAKDIPADDLIPCCPLKDGTDEYEASLAANIVREPMHPADQYEAFNALIEKGQPIPDIAARFGVSEHVVKQRLKMVTLSPKVFEAYRADKITLAQAQAFTTTDDQEKQRKTALSG